MGDTHSVLSKWQVYLKEGYGSAAFPACKPALGAVNAQLLISPHHMQMISSQSRDEKTRRLPWTAVWTGNQHDDTPPWTEGSLHSWA